MMILKSLLFAFLYTRITTASVHHFNKNCLDLTADILISSDYKDALGATKTSSYNVPPSNNDSSTCKDNFLSKKNARYEIVFNQDKLVLEFQAPAISGKTISLISVNYTYNQDRLRFPGILKEGGRRLRVFRSSLASLHDRVLRVAIAGDVIVMPNGLFNCHFLYMGEGKVANFSRLGVLEFSLARAIGSCRHADILRCCDDWTCRCRLESVLRAREEVEGETNNFPPDSFQIFSRNSESFCFFCVHRQSFTLRGLKGLTYGLVPAKSAGGSALAGVGVGVTIGLLGGPVAPVTVPLGAVLGATVGGAAGLLVSLAGGAVCHAQKWAEIKCFCSCDRTVRSFDYSAHDCHREEKIDFALLHPLL